MGSMSLCKPTPGAVLRVAVGLRSEICGGYWSCISAGTPVCSLMGHTTSLNQPWRRCQAPMRSRCEISSRHTCQRQETAARCMSAPKTTCMMDLVLSVIWSQPSRTYHAQDALAKMRQELASKVDPPSKQDQQQDELQDQDAEQQQQQEQQWQDDPAEQNGGRPC